jgi:alpha-amylase
MDILHKLTHPLFYGLTVNELHLLVKASSIELYDAGQIIVKQGHVSQGFYVMLMGAAKITHLQGGATLNVGELKPTDLINEISILTTNDNPNTVVAIEPTVALMLDVSYLKKSSTYKGVYRKLHKNLMQTLSSCRSNVQGAIPNHMTEGKVDHASSVDEPITILVLFGWRWVDIIHEVPFLAQHGYDAIKISPPQEFVVRKNRPWWEMYQPVSYFLSNFYGSEEDFKSMIYLCHQFKIKVYVDLILNHMADDTKGVEKELCGTNGTRFSFHSYDNINADGDSYGIDDFYGSNQDSNCQIDDNDYVNFGRTWHLEHHELLNLPKLNLEKTHVVNVLRKYIQYLLDLGVDGFRVDAAKHLDIDRAHQILSGLRTQHNLSPFIYLEYYVCLPEDMDIYSYMEKYFKVGRVTSFEYGKLLSEAMQREGGHINHLLEHSFGTSSIHCPGEKVVAVLDNHDTERLMPSILSYKNNKNNSYVLAYIFMLAWPFGIPKVMSSFRFENDQDSIPSQPIWQDGKNTCFNPDSRWVCQHRWNAIANMVLFRKSVRYANSVQHRWWNTDQIAFSRSYEKDNDYIYSVGFVVINNTEQPLKKSFDTGLPAGKYVDLITGQFADGHLQGKIINVKNGGSAEIEVPTFDAVVICIHYRHLQDDNL